MKLLIRTVLLLTFITFTASAVYPCVCEIMSPSKKLRKAKAVFVGEVIEIVPNEESEWATVAVAFKVERYWKGVKTQLVKVVGAPATAGSCGLPVELGQKYLIYAFNTGDTQLSSDFCVSRRLDHAAEDLTVIGKGKALINKKILQKRDLCDEHPPQDAN